MKHVLKQAADLEALRFDERGLVPVIAQDEVSGAVLMLAWANRDALEASLASGKMTYWSRSRQRLWTKGETSGHTQQVKRLMADCDRDAVLALVRQQGPACHEETSTCWEATRESPTATWLGQLDRLAATRLVSPESGWTDKLLANPSLVADKVVEEANEVATVLRGHANEDSLEHEAADLLYHLVVALRGSDSSLSAALADLAARAPPSDRAS